MNAAALSALLRQRLLAAPRLVRYFFVGGLATGVYMLAGIVFDWLWPQHTLTANTLAFCVAFIVSYAGQRYLTFTSSTATAAQAGPRFLITQLAGLGLNTLIVAALLHLGVHYYICMPVASLLVPLAMYPIQKRWAFGVTR
ncbi:MAG: GtrA family protein [Desulfovibrionaceae bacterium]|nr:GtrA family protein [Desulfovibrionaceae bacterium]